MKVRLGDYIEQIRGVSYSPTDLHKTLDKNAVILLRANNIAENKINFTDVVYVDRERVLTVQFFQEGDILVCASSGSKQLVGKAAYISQSANVTFGAFCKIIRPKVEVKRYIGYFFESPYYRKRISELSMGANINNIRNEHIDNLVIELPEICSQKVICAELDKLSELIEKRKQQLKKLDLLVKSQFIEMFGDVVKNNKRWIVFPMSSAAPIKAYKGKVEAIDGKVWLLNLDMIEAQTGDVRDEVLVSVDEVGASTVAFNRDNILYSKLRPYLNKVVNPKKTGYATSELVPLRPDVSLFNKDFFTALLRSDAFVYFIQEQVAGAKMPRVSMDIFKKFDVICPPIELQNQFARFVEQTDKSKFAIKQSLEKLETLKKALMQKYFG